MGRRLCLIICVLILPIVNVQANDDPFNFYIDEELIIHPGEIVPLRFAWHNLVDDERHFIIELNQTSPEITVLDLETNWTRVASGRLGEMTVNVSAQSNASYGSNTISFDIKSQEDANWMITHELDVVVSRWSDLVFGANNGSSFYVQQNVNTTLAMNISNKAGFTDLITISMKTNSDWEYGFIGDTNNDKELQIELLDGGDVFVNFYIITPPIVNGSPLAATGPSFTLEAMSGLDKRIVSWNFVLEMQTFHNITIDSQPEELTFDPGDEGRIPVTIRNNGNTDTFLDTRLKFGIEEGERLEINGWTVAIFNAFEMTPLSPNESRTIEIGFDSPNIAEGNFSVELIAQPLNFPQRAETIELTSSIKLTSGGEIIHNDLECLNVEITIVCQKQIQIKNNGNFFDQFKLSIVDESNMHFEISNEIIGLSRDDISQQIPLNLTVIDGIEGLTVGTATLQLSGLDGEVYDSLPITATTSPFVDWKWSNADSAVSNNRLEIVMTLRNEGNIEDGLIVKISSSYFTDMSIIPPDNAIFETNSEKIRSFEIIGVPIGSNFTFRAWAEIPDDQKSSDFFFLNVTANSRLAEDKPFTFSANTTFDAVNIEDSSKAGFTDKLTDYVGQIIQIIWAWKYILGAVLLSGLIINKAVYDRRVRNQNQSLLAQAEAPAQSEENWMEEFARKKQQTPQITESPAMDANEFSNMFMASSGPRKPSMLPVNDRLVDAANTVIDHHDQTVVKSKMQELSDSIARGEVSKPHSANSKLPDDIVPITNRTVIAKSDQDNVPDMFNLDDLDLE